MVQETIEETVRAAINIIELSTSEYYQGVPIFLQTRHFTALRNYPYELPNDYQLATLRGEITAQSDSCNY